MFTSFIKRIYSWMEFMVYQTRYGIRGTETQWSDGRDFTPFILDNWLTRQSIALTLRKNGYCVKEFPNPFRLEAYKGNEEFILDCPETSKQPTPWGLHADNPTVSIIPVKWVPRWSVSNYLVTDLPNRTGMVGVAERGSYYPQVVTLMRDFGEIIEC